MKHALRTRIVWAFALVAGFAISHGASAQQPAAPAPQPAAPAQTPAAPVAPTSALAAGQQAPPVDRYVVGQATPQPEPGTTLTNMTLNQAMELALEKNLELRAARMNPQTFDYSLQAARAAFSPQFTGSYSYRDQAQANNSTLEARNTVNNINQNYNMSMSETLPWYGGRLTANFTNGRTSTNSSTALLNPNFSSGLSFNYTQPLLAGFKIDNARNQLRTLSIQRQVADIQLATTIENTKAQVRTAYWNLRQQIENIEIQKRALDLANRLFQDNRIKVEIGTLAPIETTTSETQVANAEQALLNAQIQWINAEQALKRLLAEGQEDPLNRATINPVEQALVSVQTVDIPGAIRAALDQRTDLVQARRNLDVAKLNLEISENTTKPQLDLASGYSASGQGGARLVPGTSDRLPGGYSDAISQLMGFDLPTWNVQFNFTYPLFMKAAKANYARAQVQLQQQEAQLKASEFTVTVNVSNAGRNVENTYKQYQAAQRAREAAEKNAEAEQTRFDVGMSTNYNVVIAQNNLTSQRVTELQRLIAYLNAVAEFDRVQRVGGN